MPHYKTPRLGPTSVQGLSSVRGSVAIFTYLPRPEAPPSLGGASVRSRMVGSGAISLISGGSMKHVVVDVAEEGGIHQIRGRYGEIQRFSSRFSSFVC